MAEIIHVLDHKVQLYQPQNGFRTSFDSVMLAAASKHKTGDVVVDLGSGVGGALFCAAFRVPDAQYIGIEREAEYFELAQKNRELNPFAKKVEFIRADIFDYVASFEKPFADAILMNPPFYNENFTSSPDILKQSAKGFCEDSNLEGWLKVAHKILKSKGHLMLIFPSFGLDVILKFLHQKFGEIEILPLQSKAHTESKRVIVRARKDRHAPLKILPAFIVHEEDGRYTKKADEILRDGKALF